jgi:site-specific DNA-methyltransferase (adenine-specific)
VTGFGGQVSGANLPAPYYCNHGATIYHADCLEIIGGLEGIGAVVTDPPYSSGGMFRSDRMQRTTEKYINSEDAHLHRDFSGDNRDQRSFLVWACMWMTMCLRASKPGSDLLCFSDWRQLPTITDAVQCGGWVWRNLATWWKSNGRIQKGRLAAKAEYICYATNGPVINGPTSIDNVFRHPVVPLASKTHTAQKPVGVVSWLLGIVPDGEIVLDPFMGSGTTLVAASLRGLPFIGIELDERYCEIAAHRIETEAAKEATK